MGVTDPNTAPGLTGDASALTKIDRYEVLRHLATGGMAELFLAKQSGLEGFEKIVVIKRILRHLAQDQEFVSMFLDEARIAAKLTHPNIVAIYDLGRADDSYYIAMEYVSGRNVQHITAKQEEEGGLIPIEHTCRIIAGVCDGLHYAHSRKDYDGKPLSIVHRDISPQNILVSFAGGVKVVDFGIAKASTQLAETRAGVLKGKYAYMSPEQVRGQQIDHRSDIFALGLVMYEMLTGHRPFERDSSLKTLKAIVQEKPANPQEYNPEIPTAVKNLLSRALEKKPERRYKSAQEMQLAIEDYLESSPRKSNNVRLSQYLYDLFDDELNSKQSTMIVQGIGEVIIPTRRGQSLERSDVEPEEVDSATLSAALMPARYDDSSDEGALAHVPEAHAEDHSEDEEDDDSDDRTVPVYDIEQYERERQLRAMEPGESGPLTAPSARTTAQGAGLPSTVGSDELGRASDPSSPSPKAMPTPQKGAKALPPPPAAPLGAQVNTLPPDLDTGPPPTIPTWENPAGSAAEALHRGLESAESVVGPDGVLPRANPPPIRPAASPREGAVPSRARAVAAAIPPPPPVDRNLDAGATPSAPLGAIDSREPPSLRDPTSDTAENARATMPLTFPPWVRFFRWGIALLVTFTIVGALGLFALGNDDDALAGAPGLPRILVLDTEPTNLELRHNEVSYRTPATLIVVQGQSTQVQITHQGASTPFEIDVPIGAAPLQFKIPLGP